MSFYIKILGIFFVLLMIPSSYALENDAIISYNNDVIIYNENENPLFEYNNSPLIETLEGYYVLNNSYIGGNINFSKDSKLNLISPINGRFWHADSNISFNYKMMAGIVGIPYKIGPTNVYNESTGQSDVVGPENNEWTTWYGGEELSSINSYLNQMSYRVSFTLDYKVLNNDVNSLTPFIFELGRWPQYVNNKDINESLNISIYSNGLIIHGYGKVLIFQKNLNDFYYTLYQNGGNYYLIVQETQVTNSSGKLIVAFRPIKIESDIKIIEILPPANLYSSFRLQPKFTLKSSNNLIDNINLTYISKSVLITKNEKIQSDGTIIFNEFVELEGNRFWYPFDSYYAEIIFEPPLLSKEGKNMDLPEESDFEGRIQTDQSKITISIERKISTIIKYYSQLIVIPIIFILGLIFKKTYLQIGDLGITAFLIWYILNNVDYIVSIGSFASVFLFIMYAIIRKKYLEE